MHNHANNLRFTGGWGTIGLRVLLLLGLLEWAILGTASARPLGPEPSALTPVWTFSGGVYQGQPGDYTTPLAGVTVAIYGANSTLGWGTWIRETTTNRSGAFSLSVSGYDGDYAYYNIVETDPLGHTSTGALSGSGGEVVTANWIRFSNPSSGGYAENFFWDVPVPTATPTPTFTVVRPTRTPSPTPTHTRAAAPTPTATSWAPVVEIGGAVFVTPIQLPMPEVEVSLYGSQHPMELEQRLDVTETTGDGSFVLRYTPALAAAQGYPYLILVVTDPEYRAVGAWSESGGEVVAGNRLVWHQPSPGHYGGNGFRVSSLRVYLPIVMKQGVGAIGSSTAPPYCADWLRNGGFEAGSFAYWTVSGTPQIVNYGYSGSWAVRLAYYNNDHNVLRQSVNPLYTAAGVKFSGWVQVYSAEETGRYDRLIVTVQSSGGFAYPLQVWNDAPYDTWIPLRFAYFPQNGLAPGETWQVIVDAQNDYSRPTTFFLDALSLTFCCAEDHYEPYNDYYNAYYLVPGATYEVRICPNLDEDWFRFPVIQGQVITADLWELSAELDMNLYSSPSRELCPNLSGTFPKHCQVIADSTGEWRVRVVGAGGDTNNSPALLRVQVTDPPTATPTPTATSFRATRTPGATATPTPTSTRAATGTPTRTRTGVATKRVSFPIIMK